jgi:hypothetical protein
MPTRARPARLSAAPSRRSGSPPGLRSEHAQRLGLIHSQCANIRPVETFGLFPDLVGGPAGAVMEVLVTGVGRRAGYEADRGARL